MVLAFGNPLGIGQTVTMGIVGAKGRATGVGDGAPRHDQGPHEPLHEEAQSVNGLCTTAGSALGLRACGVQRTVYASLRRFDHELVLDAK